MIVQYLIDWKHIRRCIDNAANNIVYAVQLQSRLVNLRNAIEANGILILDEFSKVREPLALITAFAEEYAEEYAELDEGGIFGDLRNILITFDSLYEDRKHIVEINESTGDDNDYLKECVQAWTKHSRRIATPREIKGFVIITDRFCELLSINIRQSFICESIDSYEDSDTEMLRKKWLGEQTYDESSKNAFYDYMNAFCAAAEGQAVLADPFWSEIAKPEDDNTPEHINGQKRWKHSSKALLQPFLSNSDITELTIISKYPVDYGKFAALEVINLIEEMGRTNKIRHNNAKGLLIRVLLLKKVCNSRRMHPFHNRAIVGGIYSMRIPEGLDICDENGLLNSFHPYSGDKGEGSLERDEAKFRRCQITDHVKRSFCGGDIDMPRPYEKCIRPNPQIRLVFEG